MDRAGQGFPAVVVGEGGGVDPEALGLGVWLEGVPHGESLLLLMGQGFNISCRSQLASRNSVNLPNAINFRALCGANEGVPRESLLLLICRGENLD